MKIAYLTQEQYDAVFGKYNTEYSTFAIFQDDISSQYYLVESDIINTNVFELLWVRHLELTDLPQHEYYKFKMLAS